MTKVSSGYSVSVVIPAYNAERYIRRAVDSVLIQNRPADEIIVVDDGSTDATAAILSSYGDQVIYIRQQNAGASVARNTGIKRAACEWIAFLDADDQWLPDKLQRQIDHLRANPDIGWSYTNYQLIDEVGKPPRLAFNTNPVQCETGVIQNYIEAYAQYCIRTSTLIVKKQWLVEAGLFLPHLKISEDNDLFWKIAYKHPKIGYIHQPLLNYQNNLPTSLTARFQFFADQRCDLIEHHLELSNRFGQRNQFSKGISEKTAYWIQQAIKQKERTAAKVLLKRLGYLIPFKLRFTFFIQTYFPYYKKITRKVSSLISRKQKNTPAKLKIAMVVPTFPCLSETFILNQITGLIDVGCDVRIIAFIPPRDPIQHSDVAKYQLLDKTTYLQPPKSKWTTRIKATAWTLTGFLRHPVLVYRLQKKLLADGRSYSYPKLFLALEVIHLQPDILHCHYGPMGNESLFLKEIGLKAKISTVFHGYDLSAYLKQNGTNVYQELFKRGDIFFPISEFFKNKLISLGCPKEKIFVIHMGVDTELFKPVMQTDRHHKIKLLTIARLVEKKGHCYAIEAMKAANEFVPLLEYHIAGDGPLLSSLVKQTHALKLENKVFFHGPIDRKTALKLYQKCDIFLLPSTTGPNGDMEGIPVCLMEAMSCELPVISTYHSGIPELVIDQEMGYTVSEKDINAIAGKVVSLSGNPELRNKMGCKSREYVVRYFNASRLAELLYIRFRSIVHTHKYIWQASINHELKFWDDYFRTKGLQWKDDYGLKLDPEHPLQEVVAKVLPKKAKRVRILDVGAGPLTFLGKKCADTELLITAVDPLAKQYNKILKKYDVQPIVRTEKLDAERLTTRFAPNSFDLVFARNCIDHAYDPEKAILEMIAVVKKGCCVLMMHRQNEAENEGYRGLHQWNFSINETGDFLISSVRSSINFSEKNKGICQVNCEIDPVDGWLVTKIKKLETQR